MNKYFFLLLSLTSLINAMQPNGQLQVCRPRAYSDCSSDRLKPFEVHVITADVELAKENKRLQQRNQQLSRQVRGWRVIAALNAFGLGVAAEAGGLAAACQNYPRIAAGYATSGIIAIIAGCCICRDRKEKEE